MRPSWHEAQRNHDNRQQADRFEQHRIFPRRDEKPAKPICSGPALTPIECPRQLKTQYRCAVMIVVRHLSAILLCPFLAAVVVPYWLLTSWAGFDTRWGSVSSLEWLPRTHAPGARSVRGFASYRIRIALSRRRDPRRFFCFGWAWPTIAAQIARPS